MIEANQCHCLHMQRRSDCRLMGASANWSWRCCKCGIEVSSTNVAWPCPGHTSSPEREMLDEYTKYLKYTNEKFEEDEDYRKDKDNEKIS